MPEAKAHSLYVAIGKNPPAGWSREALLRLPQSFAELAFCSDPYRVLAVSVLELTTLSGKELSWSIKCVLY